MNKWKWNSGIWRTID